MKALIVEDEANARDLLKHLCEKYCDLEVAGTAGSVDEAELFILDHKPELVFLDISLPVHNGFELVQRMSPVDFQIIFVTAYDEYALQAIKASAVDYLLKPVSISDLKKAVEKAKNQASRQQKLDNMEQLIMQLQAGAPVKKISIPDGKGMIYLEITKIIRCKANGRYTEIYLESGDKHLVTRNLGEFEQLLTPHGFIRVHHSHLINPAHLMAFEKADGGFVKMKDGSEVEVSRRKRDDLFRSLKNFLV